MLRKLVYEVLKITVYLINRYVFSIDYNYDLSLPININWKSCVKYNVTKHRMFCNTKIATPRRNKKPVASNSQARGFAVFSNSRERIKPAVQQEQKIFSRQSLVVNAKENTISDIDKMIKENLRQKIRNKPIYEQELEKCISIVSGEIPGNKLKAIQKLKELRIIIQDIENRSELLLYMIKTEKMLLEYKKLISSASARSFINSGLVDNDEKLGELKQKFLAVAVEYISISNLKSLITKLRCDDCVTSDIVQSEQDKLMFICTKCFKIIELLDETPSFHDTKRMNMSGKYTYSREGHFLDAIKCFQGKQNIDIKELDKAISKLKSIMEFHGLTPDMVTKDQLYMFLEENEMAAHYDNIFIIHHIITGRPCADISEYEQDIMEEFRLQEKALAQTTLNDENDTRVNSINVYYKLYKLLQRKGCSYNKGDFYMLKTDTKEKEHDAKMRSAWEDYLGWTWIPTF